jgi:FkbM family methyltransferase
MENIITYETKYGLISLLKNERYIGSVFNNGGYWDEDTLLKLKKYIDHSFNILEIGGHCGTSSIIYASFINDNSKLYVYEPQEEMYKLLVKNIHQNRLENKIIAKKQGVFCFEGSGKMNNIDLDGGGGNVSKRYNEEKDLHCNFGGISLGSEGETVNLTTLDNMNLCNLGFIHCHAQGAENFIFSNSLKTINDNMPFILYTNNKTHGNYLYENICKSYPEYKNESKFDMKKYCIEKLNYTCIDNFNNSIDNLLIPPQKNFSKIIHITHKTIDEKLLEVKKQWEVLNPEYTVVLYDDKKCIEIFSNYYGNKFCDIFNFIKDGPIKCDFFRVCLIYIFGGIYVDADIKPLIPIKDYVDDDVDLMTCISYNYKRCLSKGDFVYNPQMIVAKKYSENLLDIIHEYEKLYDNKDKINYDYWRWSICTLFKLIKNFDITPNGENTFIHENKKYKFIIEEVIDKETGSTYNYDNYNYEKLKKKSISVRCKYKNKIVLTNFDNK